MKKYAISLPDPQAEAIERIRRVRGIPRSRVIQEAVDRYLAEEAERDAVRRYVEGYRRIPEREDEGEAYLALASEVLEPEDWS